jgi:cytochrome c oxidase assembly protein subunit 11
MSRADHSPKGRRDILVATACALFVAAMVGAAYAAVPLYNWFCRSTGFAGTPRIASTAPPHVLDRTVKVRFDANVAGGLPWQFEPERSTVEVRIGEVVSVNYRVTNLAARDTVGMASYNVSPATVGAYFTKINCFCFSEQRLRAGEQRDMTVVFFVDPEIVKDAEQDGLDSITLSYTMYQVPRPLTPQPQGAEVPAAGRS